MIITRVQIENYKQYHGSHDIEFPEEAIVGIVGANGTGKTTLFEAIEWCLYNPRSIGQNDVRPRGMSGHTTVTVYLETADRSQRYIVNRVLKRTPSAAIYRVDPDGEIVPIVQGTRQVSDYVTETLIGLSHSAFTATFFTRQKELHLFGSEPPAKRREAVGRMLGLETIRLARRGILDDRQAAIADARAIRTQYERESMGRDFDAETSAALGTIASCEADVANATALIAGNAAQVTAGEAALAVAQQRRDEHASISRDIDQRQRERQSGEQRVRQIEVELDQIAKRERERSALANVADRHASLKAELERQERERARYEERTNLERARAELANRRRILIDGVANTISGISPTQPVDGWAWTNNDDIAPTDGIRRLSAVIDALDLTAAEQYEFLLKTCTDHAAAVVDAEGTLKRFLNARHELEQHEQRLLHNGEPANRLPVLDRDREAALADRTRLDSERTRLEDERDRTRILLQNLREQKFDDRCPTCARPFSEGDADIVVGALRSRVADIDAAITQARADAKAADARIASIDQERKAIADARSELEKIRGRIQNSVGVIEDQEKKVASLREARDEAFARAGLSAPPAPEMIRRAQARTRDLQAIVRCRTSLTRAGKDLDSMRSEETRIAEQLAPLADVAFNPAAFQELQKQVHASDRARAEVAQIDRDLGRRPGLQTDLDAHRERLATLDAELAGLTGRLSSLAFDASEVRDAQARLDDARKAHEAAQDQYHRSRTILREAELKRDQVEKERKRLEVLATTADTRQRQADELDLMAREFMEFERYAAERKLPILNDATSALVDAMTDGKYQRVEFDQDFGITVYDKGEIDEAFPVETFSGGERDAIVLAARLALSQMIGRQAANPPGFLVLDEVFGSLDTDRRAHLLSLLGSITSTFEDLRQVFIISHVDDVRTSPVLDDVWRVEEAPDGGSQVAPLGGGAELDG